MVTDMMALLKPRQQILILPNLLVVAILLIPSFAASNDSRCARLGGKCTESCVARCNGKCVRGKCSGPASRQCCVPTKHGSTRPQDKSSPSPITSLRTGPDLTRSVPESTRFSREGFRFGLNVGLFHMFGPNRSPSGGFLASFGYSFPIGISPEILVGLVAFRETADLFSNDKGTVLVVPLMFGLRYRFLDSRWRPYLASHLGYTFAKPISDRSGAGGFGLDLFLGTEFMVTRDLSLEIGLGYFFSDRNIPKTPISVGQRGMSHGLFFGIGMGYLLSPSTTGVGMGR